MIKCLSVLFVSFLFLMTGCAPKVITNISKSYPASVTQQHACRFKREKPQVAGGWLFGWRNKKRQKREVTHWR